MATAALKSMSCLLGRNSFPPTVMTTSFSSFLAPASQPQFKGKNFPLVLWSWRKRRVCLAMEEKKMESLQSEREKVGRCSTYLVAAMMSSIGITSMAIIAVYYRFSWQMEVCTVPFVLLPWILIINSLNLAGMQLQGGEIPVLEMLGTFALSVGAAVSFK